MLSVTDLRAGVVFEDKGEYFLVLSYEHIKMGRGSGTVKVKVKNLSSGAVIEKSFGPQAAGKVKPLYLKDSVLTVACLSSALVAAITEQQRRLIEELNRPYRQAVVEQIRFLT